MVSHYRPLQMIRCERATIDQAIRTIGEKAEDCISRQRAARPTGRCRRDDKDQAPLHQVEWFHGGKMIDNTSASIRDTGSGSGFGHEMDLLLSGD